MLFSGTGTAADDGEAFRWLRLAADQGDSDATFELGRRYVSPELSAGRSAIPLGHCEVGSMMLTKAAEDRHVGAQEQLALLLDSAARRSEFGSLLFFPECLEAIPADDVLAFRWTLRAAEAGSPFAHWMAGRAYLEGKGIPQDHFQAYVHFSVAAALGQSNASKERDEVAALLSTDQLSSAQVESRKRFDAIRHE
jgi:TPR repeat protein